MKENRNTASQQGYNLVEVLIAMALLGMVLLSVVTLFVLGRSNVYGGKTMSQGVAVATHAMEDLQSLTLAGVQTAFNIPNNAVLGAVDVDTTLSLPTDNYTGSLLRSTKSISAGTDPKGYLQRWRDEILGDNKMAEGHVSVVFTPSHPDPMAAALTVGNATVMRVRVLVRWRDGLRRREVILDTVKTRRPAGA